MGISFEFRMVESLQDFHRTGEYLHGQDLGYPRYHGWVDKTIHDIASGKKRAIIGLSNGIIVGNIVYRMNGDVPGLVDVRNMRIHTALRNRYFAKFMHKQVEIEAKNAGQYGLICDVREDRPDLARFMIGSLGYSQLFNQPINLYEEGKRDIVLVKFFKETVEESKGIIHLAKNKLFTAGQNLINMPENLSLAA